MICLVPIASSSSITIVPVALNDSEKNFVVDLKDWLQANEQQLTAQGTKLYLLRNKSRGSGIGFFEAGNFYPDFILWLVTGNKQIAVFVEPHGISHEGPEHPKVQFHKVIKDIEDRLGDGNLQLESFIVTPTHYDAVRAQGHSREHWEQQHVLFMDSNEYLVKLFEGLA